MSDTPSQAGHTSEITARSKPTCAYTARSKYCTEAPTRGGLLPLP